MADAIYGGIQKTMQTRNQSGAGGAHTGMFGHPRILMGPNDGTGSGGGQGGDGGGDQADDAVPTSKKALIELISGTVHSVFTTRAERDKGKRAKEIGDAVTAALQAAGLTKKPDDPDDAGGDGGQGGQGGNGQAQGGGQGGQGGAKPRSDLEIQLYKVQKELELQKKAGEEEKAKREKAERASALNEELSKLRSALAEKVKPELLEAAVRLTSEKIVRDPETQEIMWKGDKWSEREGADNLDHYESFDLGLQKWADGIGKHFAPPKPVGGAGTGRPGADGRIKGGTDGVASDEEIGALLTASAFGKR